MCRNSELVTISHVHDMYAYSIENAEHKSNSHKIVHIVAMETQLNHDGAAEMVSHCRAQIVMALTIGADSEIQLSFVRKCGERM